MAIYQESDIEVSEETKSIVKFHNMLGTPAHLIGVAGLKSLGWKVESWELNKPNQHTNGTWRKTI